MDRNLTGLTGEYYVLAQLAQRGLLGCLTLGHTIDILVTDPESGKVTKVEVKTAHKALHRASLFGRGRFFCWRMVAKHETVVPDLVYCFVALGAPDTLPAFFLVPAPAVAKYVRWQHQAFLAAPHERPVKDTAMRVFRIEEEDPNGYRDNWGVFVATTGVLRFARRKRRPADASSLLVRILSRV